jgi:hypothetical protein
MSRQHHMKHNTCILFICLCTFCFITTPVHAATTCTDVYQITDLSNRGLDVLLSKSKGIQQASIPEWPEKNLTPFHVYQFQVACLDEIRRLESTFQMTPYPHIIVSPGQLTEKNLYKLSVIIQTEIKRIAIHLNIWGLPKQKRTFPPKTATDIFRKTVSVYFKLRILGGRKNITSQETAHEFSRAVNDMKILLNHIDPARRYRDIFPETAPQNINQSYKSCLQIRRELNNIRSFYKLPILPLQKNRKPSTINELFIQSQIILGELNQIKTVTGVKQPAPVFVPTTDQVGNRINVLHHLIRQIKPLTAMNSQGRP